MTNQALNDRIEDYLNGLLSEEETILFEQDLLKEEVAAEFREILFMRELLRDLPPHDPPPGLVERIEKSLALEKSRLGEEAKPEGKSSLGRIVKGVSLGILWPKYALAGISGGSGAVKDSFSAMNSLTYSLGPLREPAREGIRSIRPKKPLWKMALSRLW